MDPQQSRREYRPGGFGRRVFGVADQSPFATVDSPLWQHEPSRTALDVAVDAFKLADLQVQLLTADVCQFWSGARLSMASFAAATAMLIAALPVGLFGIAEYLRRAIDISIELSLLLVALVTILGAGAVGYWGYRQLMTSAQHMQNSADELRENLRWLRSLLHEGENS